MPTKNTTGLLVEDYKRAIRAAKWAGWKVVRITVGDTTIELIGDEAYLEKLAQGQPPAPNAEQVEVERRKFDLKDW